MLFLPHVKKGGTASALSKRSTMSVTASRIPTRVCPSLARETLSPGAYLRRRASQGTTTSLKMRVSGQSRPRPRCPPSGLTQASLIEEPLWSNR